MPSAQTADAADVRRALLIAAPLGIAVSLAAVAYLGLVHGAETLLYDTVPDALGFDGDPGWYVCAVLAVGGALVGLVVSRLPGRGGHEPLDGIGGGPTALSALPGVLLAAVISLGVGAVLGPEAPLLALGTAFGLLAARAVGTSGHLTPVVAAAGAFGALSALLGGPLVAAVLVLEQAVMRRLPLPAIVPGLLAASVGFVVFAGTDRWAGVVAPSFDLGLQPATSISLADVLVGAVAAAGVIVLLLVVITGARILRDRTAGRSPVLVTAAVGSVIALIAIGFRALTGEEISLVLFSGQESTGPVISSGAGWGAGVLIALLAAKAAAYALSLGGGFRGGLIFPAIMLGATVATAASLLPGDADPSLASALAIAAAVAAVIRMPFTATVLAAVLIGPTPEVSVLAGIGAVLGSVVSSALNPEPDSATADAR